MDLVRLEEDLALLGRLLREPFERISASKITFALWDVRAIVSNERLIDIETDAYFLRSSKTSKRPPYARDAARIIADSAKWSRDLAGAFRCLDENGPTILAIDLPKKPLKGFMKVAEGNLIRMKWSIEMSLATHAATPQGTTVSNEADHMILADWLLVSEQADANFLERSGY